MQISENSTALEKPCCGTIVVAQEQPINHIRLQGCVFLLLVDVHRPIFLYIQQGFWIQREGYKGRASSWLNLFSETK